uniref:Uncharacterized protein n=1 Tax=Rhizophagus irregularis (strain DAOM 181602 / DAOM 197198 / MUCL 43194) TaxID=747089 RepID=U9SPV3_RHIID
MFRLQALPAFRNRISKVFNLLDGILKGFGFLAPGRKNFEGILQKKVKEADRLSYRRQGNPKTSSGLPYRRFAAFQRNFEGFHDFPIAYLDRISKNFEGFDFTASGQNFEGLHHFGYLLKRISKGFDSPDRISKVQNTESTLDIISKAHGFSDANFKGKL